MIREVLINYWPVSTLFVEHKITLSYVCDGIVLICIKLLKSVL